LIHLFPEEFTFEGPFNGFTDPFRYAPHPAVLEAARIVTERIASDLSLAEAFAEGKMLGVLICRLPSEHPSVVPNEHPSVIPSEHPSVISSDHSSVISSEHPSVIPSEHPSVISSEHPSVIPSEHSSVISSEHPSVISSERSESRDLCYIAAFSGNVGGRSHIDGFVPPVFDLCTPQGHFKIREAEITKINHRIYTLSNSDRLLSLESELRTVTQTRDQAISGYRMQMAGNRIRREDMRSMTSDPHVLAGLIKESQHEKAEFRRFKAMWEEKIAELQAQVQVIHDEISSLKVERARMSDELQEWIFRQYIVHNALGESSSIAEIFASHGLTPPGGTGECAAPKLLEYAYRNGLEPLAMGEFWYGRSPETAVRTHGHFYPSCTSKCGPLLGYMMKGLESGPSGFRADGTMTPTPVIIYEDDHVVIAEKPSGMPSVPGLDRRISLEEYLTTVLCFNQGTEMNTDPAGVHAVHRLDMDTSGIMVFAKTEKAASALRQQFAEHSVRKTYMARVALQDIPVSVAEVTFPATASAKESQLSSQPMERQWIETSAGCIDLPLSADYDERPRQKVDFQHGKPAHTEYEIVRIHPDNTADLLLRPVTGRTHQLRVHCAHALGLGSPILGDLLYGGWSIEAPDQTHRCAETSYDEMSHIYHYRLHLHALSITFRHPATGAELTFTSRQLCYPIDT